MTAPARPHHRSMQWSDAPPSRVAWHGDDQYAVARLRQCLNRDGQWGSEPRERSDEWIAANRYPYADALRIARRAAVELAIRGRTAAQVLIEEAA